MAHMVKNLTNCIWHAFHALQNDPKPTTAGMTVAKSKLKVLTANIGTLMDLHGVEKGLEHYRSTETLTFEVYMYYLQREVFSSLTDATSSSTCQSLEDRVCEICWLVCRKHYLSRSHPAVFTDYSVYQLFRIFCLLAEPETETSTNMLFMVTIHSDEVAQVALKLVTSLGLPWDPADFSALAAAISNFRFSTFLAVLESKYSGGGSLDPKAVTEAIDDLFQTYVQDVIKKGYLFKKGFLLPTLKYLWFVLQPGQLTYYKDAQQKDALGVITLDTACLADSASTGRKPDKKFILSTQQHRCIELVAQDHRGRLQWLAALEIAIKHSAGKIGYQRYLANQRRSTRQAVKQEKDETRLELENERQARIAAEIQAKKLEALSKEECAKVEELEDIKRKLEILLEEEKQALRDEEIVIGLQARVLREEWEKREQLEKLQQEQQQLLECEKLKRLEFEKKEQENEKYLQDAEARLKKLEIEKRKLDAELRAAREKAARVEEEQNILLQIRNRGPKSGEDGRRRAQSFIPNTKETSNILYKLQAQHSQKNIRDNRL